MNSIEHEVLIVDVSSQMADRFLAEQEIRADLDRVNKELDRYTNHADWEDYALAIASGILAGVIDAAYVSREGSLLDEGRLSRARINERVNRFIQKYAADRGYEGSRLRGSIGYLEESFKVAQDNVWKGKGIMVSATNHHLADLAHHPTPLGLVAAILVRFLRVGFFVNREGEWHLVRVETSAEELVEILLPVVLAGTLNWLVDIAAKGVNEIDVEVPAAVQKLGHLVASVPVMIEVAKCADNWLGHLVSDMGGSKQTAGKGMGIPGMFLSLLYEVASLPGINQTGLTAYLSDLYTKDKFDLRHELVKVEALAKQSIPVVLNEAIVRTAYFVRRFAIAWHDCGTIGSIDWRHVVPFGNRTVERMLTVSSMTLTLADTTDATVHAALESGGNFVLFSQRFVARYNYVAAGRATIAIVREVASEVREAQLLREKRMLTEAKSALAIERLQEYETWLEGCLEEYLAEHMETFFAGFAMMDQGLMQGDSNLVIGGNVMIQQALGYDSQFTNQDEFDELMESDEAFVL